MKITNTAIKYRTVTVVLTLLLTIGGIFSYLTVPKESNPSIEFATIVVTTIYPGASPDDVESTITQVIEQELSSINGIEELRSVSSEGVSTVVVEFTPDIETDKAYQEVNEAVDRAQPDLPPSLNEEPRVNEISTEDFPIISVNLAANYSLARLKEVAKDLQDEVEGIPGILEATLIGGLEREVQINADLNALRGYGITFNDVISTIQQENTTIPGGTIDVNSQSYSIRVAGQFENPVEEIQDLVIKTTAQGRNVYVRDVADVVFGFKDRQNYARLQVLKDENEEGDLVVMEDPEMLPVISLSVTKRPGENIIQSVDRVKQTLADFDFPSGTQVTLTGDQSVFVSDMLTDLENNIIAGIIFVILVLLFFLGARNATLVGIAIPLSMFIAFIVFQAMGQTLNFIILFSLIIALGMLVDNAVVIVENIYRFRESGYSRLDSARLATAEVGGPVAASTATTVAAFAPMLFWPGIIGEFMGYLPLTLIIALTASLFVALIINPVITGIFVKAQGEKEAKRQWPKVARYGGAAAMLLVGLILAIANWKTLLVLAVLIPAVYFGYSKVLKPIADRFSQDGLPRLVTRYRGFLNQMLSRDYSGRRALLRNSFSLGALAVGVVVCMLGGAISAGFGQAAGMVLLVPGGLLAVAGVIGVIFHCFESIYIGGRMSVRAGLIFAGIMAFFLALIYVSPRPLALETMAKLMVAPLVIIVVGFLGVSFNKRKHVILTDNRSRLLNGSIGALFLIVILFSIAPTGQAFFPETDPSRFSATLKAPLGTNVEASNRIAKRAERRLTELMQDDPAVRANVENILVNVGVGGDAMFGGGGSAPEEISITFNMIDFADRAEPSTETLEKIREALSGITGTELQMNQQSMGPPTSAPVNIEVSGPDFERATEITRQIKNRMREGAAQGDLPGLVDISDDLNQGRPELQVNINRERAAQFGLSTVEIAQTVRAAIQGTRATSYRAGEDEYDITVRLAAGDRQNLEALEGLTILHEGNQIPLVSVADLEIGSGFGAITRLEQERVISVTGDAAPGYNGPEVLGRVQEYLADYRQELPPGYSMEYTGANEEQQESFGFLFTALLLGVALILMIMIAEFNSIAAPFIIIVAVGLSLIGVMLGLILTRTPFNLFTFIGIIGLAGIVVNNNIVLIDYIMQLRQRGEGKHEAIIEGGATRLRPVILTAMTTMIGLVPLTFGINFDFVGLLTDIDPNFQLGSENTQFWGPMGTAIISGLLFGTFLTLVIVPVMYSVFDSLSTHMAGIFGADPDHAGIVSDTVKTQTEGAPAPDGSNGASEREEDVRFDPGVKI